MVFKESHRSSTNIDQLSKVNPSAATSEKSKRRDMSDVLPVYFKHRKIAQIRRARKSFRERPVKKETTILFNVLERDPLGGNENRRIIVRIHRHVNHL